MASEGLPVCRRRKINFSANLAQREIRDGTAQRTPIKMRERERKPRIRISNPGIEAFLRPDIGIPSHIFKRILKSEVHYTQLYLLYITKQRGFPWMNRVKKGTQQKREWNLKNFSSAFLKIRPPLRYIQPTKDLPPRFPSPIVESF